MTEKNNSSSDVKEESASKEDQNQPASLTVLLALIEHASRPLAILVIGIGILLWLTWAKDPLFDFLNRTQNLKVGSIEVQLQTQADAQNLGPALQSLRELTSDQLALFLVIGRERGSGINYEGPEVTEENLHALEQAGLVVGVQRASDGRLTWRVSDEGNRLYDIIYKNIELAIRLGAAPTATP